MPKNGATASAPAQFSRMTDTLLLDNRPQLPDEAARVKMMKPQDIAECAILCINLSLPVIVEEALVRPR